MPISSKKKNDFLHHITAKTRCFVFSDFARVFSDSQCNNDLKNWFVYHKKPKKNKIKNKSCVIWTTISMTIYETTIDLQRKWDIDKNQSNGERK